MLTLIEGMLSVYWVDRDVDAQRWEAPNRPDAVWSSSLQTDAKLQAKTRPFHQVVIPRHTDFKLPDSDDEIPIQQLYALLSQDESRNDMIFDDLLKVLEMGRSPILLTDGQLMPTCIMCTTTFDDSETCLLIGDKGALVYDSLRYDFHSPRGTCQQGLLSKFAYNEAKDTKTK